MAPPAHSAAGVMPATRRDTVEHISEQDLAALVTRQVRLAAERRISRVRDPEAFRNHLLDVARRAEQTAMRLVDVMPDDTAPDPCALFVAGAWHDGGKILSGDNFHEIASAVELLEHGSKWGLVRGPADAVAAVLRRAARAILAGFASTSSGKRSTARRFGRRPRSRTRTSGLAPRCTRPSRTGTPAAPAAASID